MAQTIMSRSDQIALRDRVEEAALTVLAHEPEPAPFNTVMRLTANAVHLIESDVRVIIGNADRGMFTTRLSPEATLTPGSLGLERIATLNLPLHLAGPGASRATQLQQMLLGVRLEIDALGDTEESAPEVVRLLELQRSLHEAAFTARHSVRRALREGGHPSNTDAVDRLVIHMNSNAKMSRGKFAAQAVHAALLATDAHPGTPVIVLGAKPRDIEALRVNVRDAGHTEVEPGTLTAGTNWPEAEPERADG